MLPQTHAQATTWNAQPPQAESVMPSWKSILWKANMALKIIDLHCFSGASLDVVCLKL